MRIKEFRGSIAIFIIWIIMTMPLAAAQFSSPEQTPENFDEKETGSSILVQVNSYEPRIVPSNILEEDDAPVYAFLTATTAGSLLAEAASVESGLGAEAQLRERATSEPLFSAPEIRTVVIRPTDENTADLIRGNPRYIRPRQYSLDNLGYLMILLRKVETEDELPEDITLNMEAEIWFENAERLFSLIQQDLVLPLDADEVSWKSKPVNQYGFFAGRGYIRASEISSNNAQFVVYSGDDRSWPYTGSPRPIQSLNLDLGETSDFIRLQETGELIQNTFRVKLLDIIDQTENRVKLSIESDGRLQEIVVAEGSRLFPGSEWTVSNIEISDTDDGTKYEITITSANDRKIISAVYPKGTLQQNNQDPCERSPVLLGNLAATTHQEQRTNGELNGSSLFYLNGLRQMNPSDFSRLVDNTVQAGRYLTVTEINQNTATLRIDNLEENLQRGSGWFDVGKTLLQTFITEVRARLGDSNRQEFTLRQGSARRVSVDDFTYIITVNSIDSQRDNVKISVTRERNLEPGVAEIRPTVSISTNRPSSEIATEIGNTSKDFVYCTAIQQYKKMITDYQGIKDENGVLLSDRAAFRIGKIYEEIGYPKLAVENYQKSLENGIGEFLVEAQGRITALQNAAESGARIRKEVIQDNGREVHVRAGSIFGNPESRPKATLLVEGKTKSLVLGEKVFSNDFNIAETREGPAYSYNWRIRELSDDFIVVEKFATSGTIPSTVASRLLSSITERETINLGETELIEGKPITLNNIDSQKFALIKIIPGTGRPLISRSNFTLHIPIEKRAIKQTPDEIADKINRTEDIIKDLDNIINKLDDVVRVWKQVCLITFAYLTLKNSFLTGISRTQARRLAMRGQDGNSGWNQYCQQNSGPSKAYGSYDDCINNNLDRISTSIEESQNSIEQVNDEIDDYRNQEWFRDLTKNYTNLDKYGEFAGNQLNPQTLRDYRYWQLMKQGMTYTDLTGSQDEGITSYNFRGEVDKQLDSFNFNENMQQYNSAVAAIEERYPSFDSLPEDDKKQIFRDLMGASGADISSEEFIFLGDLHTSKLTSLRRDERGVYANTPQGRINLNEGTVLDYVRRLDQERQTSPGSANEIQEEINRVNRNYERNPRAPLISSQGQVYVDEQNKFYVADTLAFSTGQIRDDYSTHATIEIYPDGKPYCVPSGNGNYVKVLDFFQDDSPKTIQEWNVGTDGLLCTQDDVLVRHQSVLARPENANEQNRLLELSSRIGRRRIGEVVSSSGQNFIVDDSLSRSQHNVAAPKCFDVMDPSDCQTLFGVCDPVMCPPSRFNLGGTWQVDNVVQTGLIGSLVLGLHNFNAREPVPVCLTGVLAGLRNIKSILQGYAECLKVAQTTGKSVGVCDTIRSIFTCELIWREATAIFKIRGSIFKWIGQRVFGQSEEGGEYLTLQQSFENVEDSVNFFTKEYAAQSFAAYNSRSADEIGSSICRAAIYGKTPEIGNMIDQLSTPESPPQYIATLSVAPYSDVLQQSRYSVYYHVYAGENQPVDYSVFLKSEIGDVYYMTERCRGRSGRIEKGGIADATIDCVAPVNFKEVCITVNGRTNCGFGKVTTDFGLNYLNELIVEGDVRKQIDSEEECVAGDSQGSPALLGAGIASAIGLPYATEGARAGLAARDLSTTGIARVCSVQNPGTGTNPQDYKVVGTCGNDANNRVLGNCWIDLRTVTIHDTERQLELSEQLEEHTIEVERERLGITNTINKEESKRIFDEIEAQDKKSCAKAIDALKQYDNLAERSVSYDLSGKSRMRVGESYEYLAVNCAKADPLREFNRLIVELERSLQSIVNTFNNNIDAARRENIANPQALNSAITRETTEALAQIGVIERDYNNRVALLGIESTGTVSIASIVQAFKARISSGETIPIAQIARSPIEVNAEVAACARCGDGALNQCDKEECNGINQNCYFFERVNDVLGIDIADPIGNNECYSCARANDCSSFDFDRSKCESQRCTSQSSLKCTWLAVGSSGRCIPDTGMARHERITNQNDCSECGSLFNPCDEEECHTNGASCHFTPGTLVGGDCSSCDAAQSCSDFNGDKSRCTNYDSCTISIGKRCAYNDEEEKCSESISQPTSQSTASGNAPQWLFVNTGIGEDYNDVRFNPEINYALPQVIGEYLKTKTHVTESQRDRFVRSIEDVARRYNVNPYVIAAAIEVESNWKESSREANPPDICENSYGPLQCNAGLLPAQAERCGRASRVNSQEELGRIKSQTVTIEGGLDCGTRALANSITNGATTFNDIRVGHTYGPGTGGSNIRRYQQNNRDPCNAFPNYDGCSRQASRWPVANALIKKWIEDAQRAVRSSATERQTETQTVTGAVSVNTPDYGAVSLNPSTQCGSDDRCEFKADSSKEERGRAIDMVILHGTDGRRAITAHNTFAASGLSVHYIMDRPGNYIQEVDERFAAQHALPNNERSIGIEIANAGHNCVEFCGGITPPDCSRSSCTSVPNERELYEKYNDAQMKSLVRLITEILIRNNLQLSNVRQHGKKFENLQCAAPGLTETKDDPGPLFDWCKFNRNVEAALAQYRSRAQHSTDSDSIRETSRTIAVMGDSITGWGGEQPDLSNLDCDTVTFGGTSYVTTLRQRCSGLRFTNLGINGQGTGQMLARYGRQVLNCNYNEVIIMAGVNDMPRSLEDIKSNLATMYRQAKEKRLKVIAVTVLPWKGYSSWTEAKQRKTEELNSWILNEAENIDIRVDAYSALNDPNDPGHLKQGYGGPLHPNQEGQKAVADAIIRAAYQNECS